MIKKNKRVERLLLRAGENILSHPQMSEEKFDLQGAHLAGMFLPTIEDKAPNPARTSLLGPRGMMIYVH